MNIIEKLEALIKFHSWDHEHANGDIEKLVSVDDLRAIIEEYRNSQEPEAWSLKHENVEYQITCFDKNQADEYIKNGWKLTRVLFTHPPLSDETVKYAERYRWLCNNVSNSFILTKNDDHKTNYVTAKEWIEEYAPEHFSDDDLDEIQKMKDTDTIWRLQVYPDTPIGCYVWHGATLSYAIDEAMKADK